MDLDVTILFWIVSNRNVYLNWVMLAVSNFGVVYLWSIPIAYLFLKREKKPALMLTLAMLVNTLAVFFLKLIVSRPRPFEVLSVDALEHAGRGSFPSGHTSQAALSTIVLGRYYPKISWILWILTILTAVSRIYLGVHYPSDVIAGFLEGVFVGFLFLKYLPVDKIERVLTEFWRKHIKVLSRS